MPTEKPSDGREVSPGHSGGIKAKLASRFKKRPDDHEKKVSYEFLSLRGDLCVRGSPLGLLVQY